MMFFCTSDVPPPMVSITVYRYVDSARPSIGAVFVPLNFRARPDELTHLLQVSQPRVLLAGARYLETAGQVSRNLPGGPRIAQLGAQKSADCLPEIVGRLRSELFFHRGIHRCGQQGVVQRTGAVVHEVAQDGTGRDFGEVHHPSDEAERPS